MSSYGTVAREGSHTVVTGTPDQLSAWANRSGARWPGSALASADNPVVATFDSAGDLIDLEGDPDDLSGDELTAWADDVRTHWFGTPRWTGE